MRAPTLKRTLKEDSEPDEPYKDTQIIDETIVYGEKTLEINIKSEKPQEPTPEKPEEPKPREEAVQVSVLLPVKEAMAMAL
jgi:hypothetical protein